MSRQSDEFFRQLKEIVFLSNKRQCVEPLWKCCIVTREKLVTKVFETLPPMTLYRSCLR